MKYDDLVEKYIALRDEIKSEEAEFEARIAPKKELLKKVEMHFLDKLNEMGVNSVKTPFGTVYKVVRISGAVADREVFLDFIKRTDNFAFVTSHISQDALKTYIEENNEPPPGVNVTQRAYINVRVS